MVKQNKYAIIKIFKQLNYLIAIKLVKVNKKCIKVKIKRAIFKMIKIIVMQN